MPILTTDIFILRTALLIKNGEKIELQNSVGGEDFGINISGDDAYKARYDILSTVS